MTAAGPGPPVPPAGPGPRPLIVTGLLLLDPHGHDPTPVESITFDDGGIGVVRARGEPTRVLPWEAVVSHAVEPWGGGVIPEWWVEPEDRRDGRRRPCAADPIDSLLAGSGTAGRPLPHADAGAMISIQTRTGTYRFLRSGGDPTDLARRVAEFTVRHQGAAGVSSVTTVVAGRGGTRSSWARLHPWLVALLLVVLAAAVTVILLQSAGVLHLHVLGSGSAAGPPPTTTAGR